MCGKKIILKLQFLTNHKDFIKVPKVLRKRMREPLGTSIVISKRKTKSQLIKNYDFNSSLQQKKVITYRITITADCRFDSFFNHI